MDRYLKAEVKDHIHRKTDFLCKGFPEHAKKIVRRDIKKQVKNEESSYDMHECIDTYTIPDILQEKIIIGFLKERGHK